MKRIIYLVSLVCLLTLILCACSKDNKDRIQGTWKADTKDTQDDIGEELVVKGQNIKINDDNDVLTDSDFLKYYNFKDKNHTKIRFYTEKPDSEDFDKSIPHIEGNLTFSKNKMIIKTSTNYKYEFVKE